MTFPPNDVNMGISDEYNKSPFYGLTVACVRLSVCVGARVCARINRGDVTLFIMGNLITVSTLLLSRDFLCSDECAK